MQPYLTKDGCNGQRVHFLAKKQRSSTCYSYVMIWNKNTIVAIGILCATFVGATGSAYAMMAIDGSVNSASQAAAVEPAIPEKWRHIKLPILVYHSVHPSFEGESEMQKLFNVDPAMFTQQMSYLRDNHYNVIPLSRLESFLTQGTPLPHCPVVITFDDGWENQFAYAFPILQQFQYTATFYVIADAIDDPAYMSWTQVRAMANAGMTIGSHTRTHPNLAQVYDNDDLRNEIVRSKSIIEERLGTTTSEFAYPYGAYNDETIQVVKDAGYTSGRSFTAGQQHAIEDLYTLKAIRVPDGMTLLEEGIPKCE